MWKEAESLKGMKRPSYVCGPAASAPHESLVEMQNLGLHAQNQLLMRSSQRIPKHIKVGEALVVGRRRDIPC